MGLVLASSGILLKASKVRESIILLMRYPFFLNFVGERGTPSDFVYVKIYLYISALSNFKKGEKRINPGHH